MLTPERPRRKPTDRHAHAGDAPPRYTPCGGPPHGRTPGPRKGRRTDGTPGHRTPQRTGRHQSGRPPFSIINLTPNNHASPRHTQPSAHLPPTCPKGIRNIAWGNAPRYGHSRVWLKAFHIRYIGMLAQFVKAFQANPSCTGYVGRCPTLQCNSPSGMHLANAIRACTSPTQYGNCTRTSSATIKPLSQH